jgi:hypothetical protein
VYRLDRPKSVPKSMRADAIIPEASTAWSASAHQNHRCLARAAGTVSSVA